MKVRVVLVVALALIVLVSLSSCAWFADNPMFPRAKLSINAEMVTSTGGATGNKNPGLVKFTFTPLNRVGVRITQYKLEYRRADGVALPSLTSTVATNIDIIPPGTPMASNAGIENFSVTKEIDLLPPDVEAHLKANRIPAVVVTVTFSGIDYANHPVSYRGGEFRMNVLEGFPEASLAFFCVFDGDCPSCVSGTVRIGCALEVDDPGGVTKVEFYINGRQAGVRMTPPFVSETVEMSLYGVVSGVAVVYDINGGISVITNAAKVSEICPVPSPSSRHSSWGG
ncbi:MAG: hypothetical protein N2205_06130 [Candidatus Caldatribacterium sp.]|nr:hypothetical protein [Candidatus Caldatribacterium sp.]